VPLLGCQEQPVLCLFKILQDSLALGVHQPKKIFGKSIATLCQGSQFSKRRGVVSTVIGLLASAIIGRCGNSETREREYEGNGESENHGLLAGGVF
jgi:hypothetical protein